MTYLCILCVFTVFKLHFGPKDKTVNDVVREVTFDRDRGSEKHRFCMILLPRRKRCPDKKLQVRRLREMSPLWELELEVFSMHPVFMITST